MRTAGQRRLAGGLDAGATGVDLTLSSTLSVGGAAAVAGTFAVGGQTQLQGVNLEGDMVVGATGHISLPDGTAADPPLRFVSALTTGLARVTSSLAAVTAGIQRALFSSVNTLATLAVSGRDGATVIAQTLATVGTTILQTSSVMALTGTAASPGTMTVTPTIADGNNGDVLTLINVGANTITLTDEAGLAGSNLQLKAATVALAQYDTIVLRFSSTTGYWHQV